MNPTMFNSKPCPICGQPVIPDAQLDMHGNAYALYTCRNRQCESGIREITLSDEQFDTLTIGIVRTYPVPRTAQMKAEVA
jgi:hypothetical protein